MSIFLVFFNYTMVVQKNIVLALVLLVLLVVDDFNWGGLVSLFVEEDRWEDTDDRLGEDWLVAVVDDEERFDGIFVSMRKRFQRQN